MAAGSSSVSPSRRTRQASSSATSRSCRATVARRRADVRRAHLFVQTRDPNAQARGPPAGSRLAQGGGFGGQPGNSGEDLAAAWTPDGSGVVFAATMNRTDWTHGDVVQVLWLVKTKGGEPHRLPPSKGGYGAPPVHSGGGTL